jgi:CheY-like chemotaxis protein
MFEPFFTTKPQGQGTGLGLATVYGFIRQCGGHINVVSTPGEGTRIEMLLPRATAATTTVTPVRAADSAHHGTETVLVVEDEPGVRALAEQALTRHGFRVLTATTAEEALELAASFEGTIHLLLTDVVMPGMKGPELGRRMRALRPALRVLLMSGYAADVMTKDDLADGALLSKPFSQATLTRSVRHALDRALPSVSASWT